MALVQVVHNWDDRMGRCYDCGDPAGFAVIGLFRDEDAQGIIALAEADLGMEVPDEHKYCSVCAANNAADGGRVVRLFDA